MAQSKVNRFLERERFTRFAPRDFDLKRKVVNGSLPGPVGVMNTAGIVGRRPATGTAAGGTAARGPSARRRVMRASTALLLV
ncbi:hypothetical protein ACGFMM_04045 [Streptomyces sp. NPDC048604]|uniref:hypothetical protein n=1 Tax=Streptomyces sp. NPDC048604 TaxID=3365578 RepID=UPI003721A5AD